MKLCKRCFTEKPFTDFSKCGKSNDGFQFHCKSCKSDLHQIHHESRMISIRRSKAVRVYKAQKFVATFLSEHPCKDCGQTDIRILEFDHLYDKFMDVSTMVSDGYLIDRIEKEITKCEVRCCNCHALKTQERLGGGWKSKFIASLSPLTSNQLKG